MTKHKIFLELETTVSMTANNDGVIAVGVQAAQVSSLVIPNVVLPPLRAGARFKYDSRVVLPCPSQNVTIGVKQDVEDNRGSPFTSKHTQPAPSLSCSCSSDNQAHSQGGTTRTLLLLIRSMLYDGHVVKRHDSTYS